MPQPLDIIYRVCKKVWYLHKRSEDAEDRLGEASLIFFVNFLRFKIVENLLGNPVIPKNSRCFKMFVLQLPFWLLMASLLQNTNWTFCRVSFSYEISSKVWPSDVMTVFATCCMQILMRLLATKLLKINPAECKKKFAGKS